MSACWPLGPEQVIGLFREKIMLETRWAEGLFYAAMEGKLDSYARHTQRDRDAMLPPKIDRSEECAQ